MFEPLPGADLLEMISRMLQTLEVYDDYKDYLQEALDWFMEQNNRGIPTKEILARFIAHKEKLLVQFTQDKANKLTKSNRLN